MTKIVVEVNNKTNMSFLVGLLKKFSFVESIKKEEESGNILIAPNGKQMRVSIPERGADFSKLTGIWEKREITLTTLRKTAWGNRA